MLHSLASSTHSMAKTTQFSYKTEYLIPYLDNGFIFKKKKNA